MEFTPGSNLFISKPDYDAACHEPNATLVARSFMDGLFHAKELLNRSLTGQGYGKVAGVRKPIGKKIVDAIASMFDYKKLSISHPIFLITFILSCR